MHGPQGTHGNLNMHALKLSPLLFVALFLLGGAMPNHASAAIAVVASTTASSGGATTLNVAKPTGLAVGDMMIGSAYAAAPAGGSVPSGWSQLNSVHDFRARTVSCKIADSSDVAATQFTWSWNNSTSATGAIMRITGATNDCANVLISVRSTPSNTASPSFTSGDVTPTTASSLIVMAILGDGINTTSDFNTLNNFAIVTSNPSPWRAAGNINQDGQSVTQAYAVRVQTTATGNYSASVVSGDTTDNFFGWILAIPPAAAVVAKSYTDVATFFGWW